MRAAFARIRCPIDWTDHHRANAIAADVDGNKNVILVTLRKVKKHECRAPVVAASIESNVFVRARGHLFSRKL
jgi:hypothetical protein